MIKGRNLDKELLVAGNRTVFDLSGSAASEMVLYNRNHDIQINKVWIKYEEATSADAGVDLNIGTATDDDAYFVKASDASKSAGDSVEYEIGDLVLGLIPKDTPVYVKSDGGKAGDGTCFVYIAYTVL